ncbi:MAG: DNA primase [Candidatus Brocadiia bacterium]
MLAEVKRSADIVDLVSRYVELKRSGRNFKALCPFHTEKTPSFIVSPERQFFHCFGCGKKGDVFTFVCEHERVDFPEAVRIVADAVGVSIPEKRGRGGGSKQLKSRLYELHRLATGYYAGLLADSPAAEQARSYLASRHFDKQTLEDWGVGYAPDSWDALSKAARAKGFSQEELAASGLVVPRKDGKGHYDRFRHRVVFPIRDVRGRVVGFGARALADAEEVKYLNSPETPLFSKSRCLYGIDRAREAIIERRRVIVAEGYTDTLMCHQGGVPWAVATLGTALTREHVGLLRRYADQVVLVFDADEAGRRAVDRSLEVFADADLDVRVAAMPAGSDPCDFLVAHGPEAFVERIDAARDLFDVKLDLARQAHDLETAAGQAKAIDEVLRSVALVSNPARADLLVQRVARAMGVELEPVRRRLRGLRRARRSTTAAPAAEREPPLDPVERGILEAVLARGELVPSVLDAVGLDDFRDARIRSILAACIDLYDREGEIEHHQLAARLQDPRLASRVAEMAMGAPERANWERWLQDCLERLKGRKQQRELHQLRERAARDAHSYDPEALAALTELHRRRAGRADDAADTPL